MKQIEAIKKGCKNKMKNIKQITKYIIKQNEDYLKNNPQEAENSVGFVRSNLQEMHVEAALWLQEHRGFSLDTYNLHDLILNFNRCKSMSGVFDCVTSVDLPINDRFNPAYLVEYFQVMKGFGNSKDK